MISFRVNTFKSIFPFLTLSKISVVVELLFCLLSGGQERGQRGKEERCGCSYFLSKGREILRSRRELCFS